MPEGHTWESYTRFLLATLPARLRENYVRKFKTSIQFWHNVGGGLGEEAIRELKVRGAPAIGVTAAYGIYVCCRRAGGSCFDDLRRNGVSNYTIMRNSRVVFLGKIPDHTDDIKSTKDIPSWKRMCYCILKNDHVCRFMGFSLSREQQKNIDFLKEKYPYLLQITYQSLEKLKTNQTASSLDVEKQSPIEIFKEFYEKMKGEAMSQESEEIIQQLLEEVSEDDAH